MTVVTLICVGTASGFAAFHTHLKRSAPGNGAQLTAPPVAIELWFSEKPELAVTSITVNSTSGAAVPLTPLVMSDASDTAAVVAKPTTAIAPGTYQIHWR
ncbi:MAG TPA: copper resistance CopC family protein, partial [Gemmatimonadaceae bacterium]